MPLALKIERCYPADLSVKEWRGYRLTEAAEFDAYLQTRVRKRVTDHELETALAVDLQGLATTQMGTDTIAAILGSSPAPLDWEIGEALAECLLEDEFGVTWPWNENRDKKTPRASLPGADLVGFLGAGDQAILLFGEVKTSFDKSQPPGVMSGRSGLAHQIDYLVHSPDEQAALIRWLHARCKNTAHWPTFEAALKNYLSSRGKKIALVGVLLRDTTPHENDLRTRGTKLKALALVETQVRLDAWYAPRAIAEWVNVTMSSS